MWVACFQFGAVAMAVRARGLSSEFFPSRISRESGNVTTDVSTFIICSCAAFLSFAWGVMASIASPHIASDISIPLLSLLLLFTSQDIMLSDISALKLSCLVSSIWWCCSALYATLLRGM